MVKKYVVHSFPMGHCQAGQDCRRCHPDNLATYTCYGCHAHNPSSIISKHRQEGIGGFINCVRCHPTGREEDGEGGAD